MKKKDYIMLRVSTKDKETLSNAAKIEDETVSEFIRTTMLRESLRIIKRHEREK